METIKCPNCGKEIEIEVFPSIEVVGYEIECPECGYSDEGFYDGEVDEEGDEDIYFI